MSKKTFPGYGKFVRLSFTAVVDPAALPKPPVPPDGDSKAEVTPSLIGEALHSLVEAMRLDGQLELFRQSSGSPWKPLQRSMLFHVVDTRAVLWTAVNKPMDKGNDKYVLEVLVRAANVRVSLRDALAELRKRLAPSNFDWLGELDIEPSEVRLEWEPFNLCEAVVTSLETTDRTSWAELEAADLC
ncbi:hypothetical protein ACFL2M_01215 [Patescibacteria group bacterium]